MNPNTGELRRIAEGMAMPAGFETLDNRRLEQIARRKLDREEPAQVNLRSRSPLADWAKKKRKAKIAAASRRRNRK